MGTLDAECFGHVRDDERLGDRLVVADRERAVVIRARDQRRRHEAMTRDLAHRFEDAWIGDVTSRNLFVDHLPSRRRLAVLRGGAAARRVVRLCEYGERGRESGHEKQCAARSGRRHKTDARRRYPAARKFRKGGSYLETLMSVIMLSGIAWLTR